MKDKDLIQQRVMHLIEQQGVLPDEHEALCNRKRYLKRLAHRVVVLLAKAAVVLAALGFVFQKVST